jgi:hypothetical protein
MTTCHRDPSGHLQATSPGKFRQSDPNCIEIGLINNMPSAAGKRSLAVAQQARPGDQNRQAPAKSPAQQRPFACGTKPNDTFVIGALLALGAVLSWSGECA